MKLTVHGAGVPEFTKTPLCKKTKIPGFLYEMTCCGYDIHVENDRFFMVLVVVATNEYGEEVARGGLADNPGWEHWATCSDHRAAQIILALKPEIIKLRTKNEGLDE